MRKPILRFLCLLLPFLLTIASHPFAVADTQTDDNGLEYEIIDNQITIRGYTGQTKTVIIPSSINNLPVQTISKDAFNNSDIISKIHLPHTITTIESYGFYNCQNLASITVDENNPNFCDVNGVLFNKDRTILLKYPNGRSDNSYIIPEDVISIDESAFHYSIHLDQIVLPKSLIAPIDGINFMYCELSTLNVTEGNPNYCSVNGVLFNKERTTLIFCPPKTPSKTYIIPKEVTTIGKGAFFSSEVNAIYFHSNITSIGQNAFTFCWDMKDVYYSGSEEEWLAFWGSYNNGFPYAAVHFNYQSPTVTYGDLNGDDAVNAKDALEVLKASVGKIQLTEEQKTAADVNKDGQTNAKDALEILKFSVGKPSVLDET